MKTEFNWNREPYIRCNIGSINRQTKLNLTDDDISSILLDGDRDDLSINMHDIRERYPEYIVGYFLALPCEYRYLVDMFVSDHESLHVIKKAEVDGDFPTYPNEALVELLNFVMVQLKKIINTI